MNSNLDQFTIARPRRVVNEAAMFVENRVALGQNNEQESPVYAPQLDRFVSVEEGMRQQKISEAMWKAADVEKDKLLALVTKVQLKLQKKSKSSYTPVDVKSLTWAQIMSEVQESGQKWKGGATGETAMSRKCLERIGHDSGALQAWIQLLPAGDYGASICGVFKLAVGAANRYVEVEDFIFDALAELPEQMEGAANYVRIYERYPDHKLERKTFELYMAILKSLNHIMQFFADSTGKRILGAITMQKAYKSALTKSLDDVKKHVANIKDEAQLCLAARTTNIDQNVTGIFSNVDGISTKIDNLEELFQRLYRLFQSNPMVNPKQLDTLDMGSIVHTSNLMKSIKNSAENIVEKGSSKATRILNMLRYDASSLERDFELMQALAHNMDDREMAVASVMVQSENLMKWLAEPTSTLLLVNGHRDLEASEGNSPLSLVDAQLGKVFQQSKHAFAVKYFCSLHREVDDPFGVPPPTKMVASLVGQLIAQLLDRGRAADVSFMTKKYRKKIEVMDLIALLNFFEELVRQLPPKSVLFCVLDELVLYETTHLERDTDIIVRQLTELADKVVFKLLVTCQGQSLNFHKHFKDTEILDLPEDIEVDDMATWNVMSI